MLVYQRVISYQILSRLPVMEWSWSAWFTHHHAAAGLSVSLATFRSDEDRTNEMSIYMPTFGLQNHEKMKVLGYMGHKPLKMKNVGSHGMWSTVPFSTALFLLT